MNVGLNMFSGALDAGMMLNQENDETWAVFVEFSKPLPHKA
ncbi:hypothetical protein [Yokenella regensburgei]